MKLFLSSLLAALLFATPAMAELVSGTASVTGPGEIGINGRSIRIDDIRMPGPKATCSEWRGQKQVRFDCSEHADATLKSLLADRTVVCAVDTADIGACYVDGRDIAERVVEEGWAVSCGQTNRYVALEDGARQGRQGMWTGNFTLDTQCPPTRP